MTSADEVLDFWLGSDESSPFSQAPKWWKKDAALDQEITQRFGALHEAIARGEQEDWRESPRSLVAYTIVLDQFSRNMFRGDPRSFAYDTLAQRSSLEAMRRGLDLPLSPVERVFLYMPLMHAEDRSLQDQSVIAFATLATAAPEEMRAQLDNNSRFAVLHRNIVVRFGRFPHRNAVLGRWSTPEELAFLKEPGSSF
jgi:uncharacterized protein (DUF924 family)